MSNCVATYAESCTRGRCSIWSLRKRADGDQLSVRVMTIEVNNATREIVQAGKLLDIDVLDHLIIGHGVWVSLRERGLGFDTR